MSKKIKYIILITIFFLLINLLFIVNSTGTEIKTFFATPKNNPKGLAWDGEYLWLVHDQDYDIGLITKISPDNGQVLYSFPSPGKEPKGLTWGDNYLWIIDEQNSKYQIFKLDPNMDGKVIDYFSLVSLDFNYPIGLAYGGNHLWVIDGGDDKIYNIDLLEKTYYPINSPTEYPRDLAWDGKNLYVASGRYDQEIIYKVNPQTGEILEKIDLPGDNPNVFGITWDGSNLWMVDDNNEIIYKLEVDSLVNLRTSKYNVVNTYKTSETAPSISVEDIELVDISNGTYYIEGTALDVDGIKSVKLNGNLVAGSNQFGGVTNIYGDFFTIEVADNSGNITQQKYQIDKSNISSTSEPIKSSSDTIFGSTITALGAIIAALIVGGYLIKQKIK